MSDKKSDKTAFPHVKGLVKKQTKFGHRWILSAPDSTGKIKNITVKISDNDPLDVFYRKIDEARDELLNREMHKSFESWLDEFITVKRLAKNTEVCYRSVLKDFGLNNAKNRAAVTAILKSGLKDSTICNRIGLVKTFFNWLSQKQPGVQNPALDVVIKDTSKPRKRIATQDELSALIERVRSRHDNEYLLFTLLLIETGARVSSIRRLHVKDLDNSHHLRLYNVKSNKQYDYMIHIDNAEIIELWATITADGLLWHKSPETYTYRLNNLIHRLFKQDDDGELLSIHSLRHTFASNAIRSGVPVEIVSKLLDHKSINTTLSVYSRFSQEQIDEAVRKTNKKD